MEIDCHEQHRDSEPSHENTTEVGLRGLMLALEEASLFHVGELQPPTVDDKLL